MRHRGKRARNAASFARGSGFFEEAACRMWATGLPGRFLVGFAVIPFVPPREADEIGELLHLTPRIMRASAMRSTSMEPSVIIMLRWSRKKRSIGSSFDSPMPP